MPINTDGIIKWVNVSVTWQDSESAGARFSNQPDQFTVELKNSTGTIVEETTTDSGTIRFNHEVNESDSMGGDDWTLTVRCDNAGNLEPIINILGLRERDDNGDDWEAIVTVVYQTELKSEPETTEE